MRSLYQLSKRHFEILSKRLASLNSLDSNDDVSEVRAKSHEVEMSADSIATPSSLNQKRHSIFLYRHRKSSDSEEPESETDETVSKEEEEKPVKSQMFKVMRFQ